jgi:hypothetical protein
LNHHAELFGTLPGPSSPAFFPLIMRTLYAISRAFAKARCYCLLFVAGFLLSATASYGQFTAPALGAASTFAVFTAVGAFNNVGPTVVLGDIGTNAGAFSGFPLGVVTGQIHLVDALSTQAATDVQGAYQAAAGIAGAVPLAVYGGTPALTLLPGAYEVGAATTLAGELILDGQNDPSALFFLRVSGALTTAANSVVTLINGAQPRNVYWQVAGLTTLGQNSLMQGTLLVDGGINFVQGATLQGRALSREGAINMDTNGVTAPVTGTPLPVTLARFAATRQGQQVLVQWTTASEQNSRSFAVERSATGATGWETIATVVAAGHSAAARSYRVTDARSGPARVYYRLRSTDFDQTFAFSSVRSVASAGAENGLATRFPNPVLDRLTVTGVQPGSWLAVVDLTGKTRQQQLAGDSGTEHLETSRLLAGSYLLRMVSAAGTVTHLKVQKN